MVLRHDGIMCVPGEVPTVLFKQVPEASVRVATARSVLAGQIHARFVRILLDQDFLVPEFFKINVL
jgi:hypothetical protein